MRRLTPPAVGLLFLSVFLAFVSVSAHNGAGARHLEARHLESWFKKGIGLDRGAAAVPAFQAQVPGSRAHDDDDRNRTEGRRLFERETFGGNGRTCLTCHSRETGTVSPEDARRRFREDRHDLCSSSMTGATTTTETASETDATSGASDVTRPSSSEFLYIRT